MNKKSQKAWVISQLAKDGKITRNQCLENYISRLSAIIYKLKNEGWEFDGKSKPNGAGLDYVYIVTKSPLREAV